MNIIFKKVGNKSFFSLSPNSKKRKNDYCIKCSALFNKQLFKSEHNLDTKNPIYLRWNTMKNRVKCEEKAKYYNSMSKNKAQNSSINLHHTSIYLSF